MGGCAAPNCSNQSKNNFRMFRFPRNEERRRKWIVNSRRDQWIPGPGAYLCEVHFEENQFECSRQDGRKKLKPNAVPTLFNVPNPPQLLTPQRLKGIGLPKHRSVTSNFCNVCLQEQASTSSCDKMPSICEGSHVCLQEQPLASFCNEIPSICEGSDDVLLRNFIKQQTELISLLQCQNKILLKELTATKKKMKLMF
ncbi:THAP domain-containing protein 2-like isoform X4 [Stegodyphus dumicola]|uniref:THAP domain-containing protein 2-like isoform X2 n=2 Tax=Stegodyphus dumicola TaxID=202533 RepID=UPI0015AB3FAB|nr:THAP domain-containing protein 2-like isoform X2 [Stegodyphus dumicola]XP_035232185.1 THAP domain-containing protein 2-like isoform X4 [Stegodyphus dumicola]